MTTTTRPRPRCKRGDVVLVLFPHSNLRTAKTRPALVIQADHLQTGVPQTIVAMITSRLTRGNHPSRVLIALSSPQGRQSGLLTDSVVMTDNLATVADVVIERIIGSVPMHAVDAACDTRWVCDVARPQASPAGNSVGYDKYMALECGFIGDPEKAIKQSVKYLRECMR